MDDRIRAPGKILENLINKLSYGMRFKLIMVFLIVQTIPLIFLSVMAWQQIVTIGRTLSDISVTDSSIALNENAVENIERLTTDTARKVADFLYGRDSDILYIAGLDPTVENYRQFVETQLGRLIKQSEWVLAEDGKSWVSANAQTVSVEEAVSTNSENNDEDGFRTRTPDTFEYIYAPLYDEVTFIDLDGNEIVKYVTPNTTKKNYPLNSVMMNISKRGNTYVKAETYFDELKELNPGEIYVSDVIGAYVGSNYIGMYTPAAVAAAAEARGYDIEYAPEDQSFAGRENPNGRRFEGIVRWATPVTDSNGDIIGYVTLALNHDHIMELVDHQTPMGERYTELTSAFEGNYAFIWDYKCRSICHPRHNSIVGFDPETGDPQIPWLESSIYDAWQESGLEKWTDYAADIPIFYEQSRSKTPAPALTKAGLVGLDGRYLNNAPQCTGWMDLTKNGGSGSFYILWSGIYKLTTAAAIPYYTGHYAPSEDNDYSMRGFGFVAIGADLEDFSSASKMIGEKLEIASGENLRKTLMQLSVTTLLLVFLVILIAVWTASLITNNITELVEGVSRFRAGERQFRFRKPVRDEFGTLAESFDDMADNIVNSVSGALCITDLDLHVIYMNPYGLRLCNKSLDEMVGTSYPETSIYPAGTKYCPITALLNDRESEVYYNEETQQYFKGEAHFFLGINGEQVGYIIVSTDVTDIQIAREKAEQASRAKGDFLSNMSHEIRTPLNTIIGMTSIGKSADDMERKDYCLTKVEDASTHLLGVINDILDMSKIEANKFELSPTEFEFENMLQKVVNVINYRMDERHHNFTVYFDANIPVSLIGDEQRLAQVITNLLSNAVKFTPENGSIRLSAHLKNEENNVCTIQIEVSDTGIGIDKEQMTRIFSSFEQAENSTTRKYGGTGLGLSISKSIIELMGGSIWIESEIGKGSTFAFTVKTERGHEKPRTSITAGLSCENARILAVDDAPDILEFFTDVSTRYGFTCDTASSGEEALAIIDKNGDYDLYFVDWKMPGIDGIELTRRIKNSSAQPSIIIMISAVDWGLVEKEARSAGVDKFLTKPLFPSTIANCIEDCLSVNSPQSNSQTAPEDTANFSGYRVLLSEDVEINREIVLILLEPTQLKIDCAENGAEALKMFSDNPEAYDMVLMDVQMPEMDGYEATRRIRALDDVWAKSVPIIAMTANVFKEDIEKCLAAGMNGHVGKPLNFDELLSVLRKYLIS